MEMNSYQLGPDATAYAEDNEFVGFTLSDYFKARTVDPSSRAIGPGACVFEDPNGSWSSWRCSAAS
jgi:hypothetical protein